ncbi:hypothetical protein [Bosea minatitlanensis]|uniref:Uncharacterized protein n=1 Tax=Bosea minatitlanensis TaxID=128782 RepID=A0ABW0EZ90_9HYPH|nr:hypothetical protein [Bosea minatitlanensis]MCT4495404.1 hypothetical protein [Bosea minatitlanensis]
MTVATELCRSTHPWTGVETALNTGYPADSPADVRVFFRAPDGSSVELVAGVNHTVSLAVVAGNKVAVVAPISIPGPVGTIVTYRDTPALVSETLQDGAGFSIRIVQQLFDRDAMRGGEARRDAARSIILRPADEIGSGAFDLQGTRMTNLGPGVDPNDAATVQQLQDVGGSTGNVPPPLASQIGFWLAATALNTSGWREMTLESLPRIPGGVLLGRASAGTGQIEPLAEAAIKTLLGISTPGNELIVAVSKAAQRAALQMTALGEAIVLAPDQVTALSALGAGALGRAILAIGSAPARQILDSSGGFVPLDWKHMPVGSVIDRVLVVNSAYSLFSTSIPLDDTAPQSNEGSQILAGTITPKSATNKLRISVEAHCASQTANGAVCVALFDGNPSAIKATWRYGQLNYGGVIVLTHEYVNGSLGPVTLAVRMGAGGASNAVSINGGSSGRLLGGSMACSLLIEEIKG